MNEDRKIFHDLLAKIEALASGNFATASDEIVRFVDECPAFTDILGEIGTIPESIGHDSSQEKLFSKASDAALARAFREIGLKSTVLKERGDSADVLAESPCYGYTMVADAKAFRLSRTAKNQKDFKITALSGWRKDADFAVLCSPYFQYPASKSQIYAQAVDTNVCLLSWEHLVFLIENSIVESEIINLSPLWSISASYAEYCVVANKKNCFLPVINETVRNLADKDAEVFETHLSKYRETISKRAAKEIAFWENELNVISAYTREQAIDELIKAKKIGEKIAQIERYAAGI